MNPLKVFVSSTCYDLSQIRADLFGFISGLGYQPILSEHYSFAINPDNDTLDNCIENVNAADIFILIIGGRYGHVVETGKSITNTEYLYAKQKGIPIYIFIHKSLVGILPIWKKKKQADFSDSLDSEKVFEFIEELRTDNKNWCFNFENAQEIQTTLKYQFAHLFKNSLEIRQKFNSSSQPDYWKYLSPRAIKIALNKLKDFELDFFAQTLKDELIKHESLKLDLDYHVLFGTKHNIQNSADLRSWMRERIRSTYVFINTGQGLMSIAFKKYYGEPGQPSDLKGLYYVATSMARLYKEMILWALDVKSTYVITDFIVLRDAFAKLMLNSANEILNYPDRIQKGLDEFTGDPNTKNKIDGKLVFDIDEDTYALVNSEIDRLLKQYQ